MKLYQKTLARGWWVILLAFVALSAYSGRFLPDFSVEAGTNVLLNEDDPDLAYYNETRADWESDEYVIACVRKEGGWFSREAVRELDGFVGRLRGLPHVKSVIAITTIPLLRNRGKRPTSNAMELLGSPTLADPRVDLERAREELASHTQALGNLVSPDGRDASVLVYLDIPEDLRETEPERNRLLGRKEDPASAKRLAEIEPRYQAGKREILRRRERLVRDTREAAVEFRPKCDEPVRLSGLPIININLVEHIRADLRTFGFLSFALFALGFAVIYRRPRWVALPMVACALPVALILGLMVALGRHVTVVTANLPVLLFVLMLPYAVYYIERYRERRSLDPAEDPIATALGASRQIWVPCLYSCTTTMAGVASLMTSGINPVRTFGLMMTIGMGAGLATIMLFLPAAHVPLAGVAVAGAGPSAGPRGPLRFFVAACRRAPGAVVVASVAVLAVAIFGATRLKVETKFIDYFWPGSEIYEGLAYIDTRMGGTTPLEVLLRSPVGRSRSCPNGHAVGPDAPKSKCRECDARLDVKPGHFETDAGLSALAAVERFFESVPETGNVRSFRTLVEEVGKAYRPRESAAPLPRAVAGLAPDLVREFCSPDFSTSRVLVRMKETAPTLHRKRILDALDEHLRRSPELQGLEVRPTGIFLLYSNMLQSLIRSQKDTFLLVLGAIFAMLVALFRNPLLALMVLLPQVLPVFVVLGTMGFAGIPLDPVTVMIASVAMGVGIDAAIQYTVRYRAELAAAGGDVWLAIERSHATIGRAILIATSIIFVGFLILALSTFRPTAYFGIFTALAMLMGLLASLTTLPSMFVRFRYPRLRAK